MATTTQHAVPDVGSAVSLLPVSAGRERTGTLSDWSVGPAGLVVTASITLTEDAVHALSGRRVWARVESDDGQVRVLEGVAVAGVERTELGLTGVLALAEERRRTAPRVETTRAVRVSLEALALRHASDAHTVDLSRTGARLRMPAATMEEAVSGGAVVEVDIAVGQDETVTAGAEVIRVDHERGELAVRFVDLAEEDAARLDRAVLTELSAQRAAPGRSATSA
jgi:hypothetical protein